MPSPPQYGIIYNWDGAPHAYSEVPQSMAAFLEKVYAPMEETQVGAHFWSIEDHTSFGESDPIDVIPRSAGEYIHRENLRLMLERGEDPNVGLIERGRELGLHVYASIRMNDCHFDGKQVEDLGDMGDSREVTIRREHPEWLLGDQTSEWFAMAWNFEVPEVRERRFAHIKDVCERYDWDGVELDWQRHGFHLPQEYAYRMGYVLTDLQRAVRRMANEVGERRGRPFYVAARVSTTLEMCRRTGYDIPTWIDEGLVDILIPAAGASTDSSIDLTEFVELCRGTDVVVYPGLDSDERTRRPHWFAVLRGTTTIADSYTDPGPEDDYTKDKMINRALASRYHREGAGGIYVFNWHADRVVRRELLTQIGSLDTLRGKDKIYAATHRYIVEEGPWRGGFRNDRLLGQVPVELKRTLTGDGPTIKLDVAEDVTADGASRVELRLRLADWVKGDVVRVYWDGVEIDTLETHYHVQIDSYANSLRAPVSDVGTAVWLRTGLSRAQAGQGAHRVKVALSERNPRISGDLVLTDVELAITYGDA